MPHSARVYVPPTPTRTPSRGFFGNLKTGIRGSYKKVSRHRLQGYLNELVWRYNARLSDRPLFEQLLIRAVRS